MKHLLALILLLFATAIKASAAPEFGVKMYCVAHLGSSTVAEYDCAVAAHFSPIEVALQAGDKIIGAKYIDGDTGYVFNYNVTASLIVTGSGSIDCKASTTRGNAGVTVMQAGTYTLSYDDSERVLSWTLKESAGDTECVIINGDLNHDGVISIDDVTLLTSTLLGERPEEKHICLAGGNGSNEGNEGGGNGEGGDSGNEPIPDTHEYVDLGLSSGTLWATCNIGAENPEDYGLYFAWGETEGYTEDHIFDWYSYNLCSMDQKKQKRYCTSATYGNVDNITELTLDDDAAYQQWGENWCMPTIEQYKELLSSTYTTQKLTTINKVSGFLITSKKDTSKSIFLPHTGNYTTKVSGTGSSGYYWSRSLASTSDKAQIFREVPATWNYSEFAGDFLSPASCKTDTTSRYTGCAIRPVRRVAP